MTGSTEQDRRGGGGVAYGSFTITDARSGASSEQATRQRRYAITMAFRTACFIAMVFVPGALRWVLFACAVFLPYVAVIFANQANQRDPGQPVGGAGPGDESAVTTGRERGQLTSGEIISGDVDDGPPGEQQETEGRDDRVA